MRHLEFLVEEPSAVATLDHLAPRLIEGQASHAVRQFGSKPVLLRDLAFRLRGYRRQIERGADLTIIVLLDEDRHKEGCGVLKARLDSIARDVDLITKSDPDRQGRFHVVNRLAVEELEAWFLGDVDAIRVGHPRVPESLGKREAVRNPDAVRGGTWERLHGILREYGYYQGFFPKIEFARKVAPHLEHPHADRNLVSIPMVIRM